MFFRILITTFVAFTLLVGPVSALEFKTASDLKLDTTIRREDINFTLPKRVVIVPLYAPSRDIVVTDDEWFRGIFYYTVDVLGFTDIPFHYLVSNTGSVYQGNDGGYERKISIQGVGEDMIVIGYMSDKFANNFDSRAIDELVDLLVEVTSANAIDPESISVSGIIFDRNEETRSVGIKQDDLFGSWSVGLADVIAQVKREYNPQKKVYSVSLAETGVVIPENEISAGNTTKVSLHIQNTSGNGIYSGTDSDLILSRVDGSASNFFLNNVWLSTTDAGILGEDQELLPFQEGVFDIPIRVPLFFGDYSESFVIKNILGEVVSSEEIVISVTIPRTNLTIVEIIETETGLLNVRNQPSSVAQEISQVSTGQRFIKTDDAGNGWIQIDLGGGETGWIAGWYTREI